MKKSTPSIDPNKFHLDEAYMMMIMIHSSVTIMMIISSSASLSEATASASSFALSCFSEMALVAEMGPYG